MADILLAKGFVTLSKGRGITSPLNALLSFGVNGLEIYIPLTTRTEKSDSPKHFCTYCGRRPSADTTFREPFGHVRPMFSTKVSH